MTKQRKAAGRVERATSAEHAQRMAYAAAKAELEATVSGRYAQPWEWSTDIEDFLKSEIQDREEAEKAERLRVELADIFSNNSLRKRLLKVMRDANALSESTKRRNLHLAPVFAIVDIVDNLARLMRHVPSESFVAFGSPRLRLAALFALPSGAHVAEFMFLWRSVGKPSDRELALLSIMIGLPDWEAAAAVCKTADEMIADERKAMHGAAKRVASITARIKETRRASKK